MSHNSLLFFGRILATQPRGVAHKKRDFLRLTIYVCIVGHDLFSHEIIGVERVSGQGLSPNLLPASSRVNT